jgi:hypothetical protein
MKKIKIKKSFSLTKFEMKTSKAPWVHALGPSPLATWNLSYQKSWSPFLAWANNTPLQRTPYYLFNPWMVGGLSWCLGWVNQKEDHQMKFHAKNPKFFVVGLLLNIVKISYHKTQPKFQVQIQHFLNVANPTSH